MVYTEFVLSTMSRNARLAQVITVGANAPVQAVEQLNAHHVILARKNNWSVLVACRDCKKDTLVR